MNRLYYYLDNNYQQQGPVDLEGLRRAGIGRQTKVWYDGLANWMPAGSLCELNELFPVPEPVQAPAAVPPPPGAYSGVPLGQPQAAPVKMPKNWLAESILVTILGCQPFGIVGIVYAAQVDGQWRTGRYEEALRSSRNAKTWTLIGFGLALASWVIYIFVFVAAFVGEHLSQMS